MAGEFLELSPEGRVGGALSELMPKLGSREPSLTPCVRHDVCDGLSAYRERDPLSGPDGIDYTASPIAQIPHADIHVRQCSTTRDRAGAISDQFGVDLLPADTNVEPGTAVGQIAGVPAHLRRFERSGPPCDIVALGRP